MTHVSDWPQVGVVGAGAVGSFFGGMLARAGAPVTLVGRPALVDAVRRDGLLIDGLHFKERIRIGASESITAIADCDVVLFSVKTIDTERTGKELAGQLRRGALVVSLQNGVDNVARLAGLGVAAVPAAVYVAVEMIAPGQVKHSGRGDLVIGTADARLKGKVRDLARWFEAAQVPCRVSDAVETDLWSKLAMNCAYNAISALARAKYGPIGAGPWTHDLVRLAVEETMAVGRALGVSLPDSLVEAAWKLGQNMPNAIASTAQDIIRGKPTEIDALNGFVAAEGRRLGIPTPVNQTLYGLVKLLEEAKG